MTRKASAARMSILILIAEPQLSSHVRGMTEQVRYDSAPARFVEAAGGTKTKRPPAMPAGGLVNPAATYSPGPGGQVPSAI